ncbi:ribonuclease R family protein, partial [Gemmiger sp.]|uniref:ribonuclease R family protein n=1 Tax=Gemmiger sp. TaxID=2049027 RepID=UPI003AB26502
MTPLQKNILNAVKRRPMTLRELQNNLQVDNSRLRTSVSAMVATGELSMRNGTYAPGFATYVNANAPETIPCTLVKLAARFGFASRDDGEGDIFIPGRALHGAMPQDKINVKLFDHPRVEGSSEGEVVEVTVPNNRFAGTVCLSEDGRLAVEPDGCRDVKFLLAKQGSEGVHLGDKVGFLITHRGNRHSDHRAAVVEKFGSSDYASECAKAILYGRNVRLEFPPEVLEEAHAYDDATIDPTEAAKRLDLRGIPIFTIDSAETKDIDDAISLQKLDDGYELGVHIADVSHYVRPGSALDEEAFERATSIYYADKVIPMLPTQLSNGICSLNEGEDRLAFSCLMRLDENGEIRSYKFVKSVICSRVKGVYKEINALLEPEEGADLTDLQTKYAAVLDQLPTMDELYRKRLVLRKARGGMDIESNEAKLVMDENGRCVDIVKRDRGTSECMIEEFMLLANRRVAEFVGRKRKGAQNAERTFVYRVHDKPNSDKMAQFRNFVLRFGYQMKAEGNKAVAKEINRLMKKIHGKKEENIISTLAIRSMAKATYTTDNIGHYGLAFDYYTHFTSTIRLYPDMMVHRLLAHYLAGGKSEDKEY